MKAVQFRLSHSRMPFIECFYNETLPVIVESHNDAYDFYGGLCEKGIYDNPRTIVNKVLLGKDRALNNTFVQLASHFMFEVVCCNPRSGWEKGQIEKQVQTTRMEFFVPRLSFETLDDLNAHLREECVKYAKETAHPEFREKTVWEVYQEEVPYLKKQPTLFDGYMEVTRHVNRQGYVEFDKNKYSVPLEHANQWVTVREYGTRIAVAGEGKVIAEHKRAFGSNHYVSEAAHFIGLLKYKPGAVRNGREIVRHNWPEPIQRVREHLVERRARHWDKEYSKILLQIPQNSVEVVAKACNMALESGVVSASTIINNVSILRQDEVKGKVEDPFPLRLGSAIDSNSDKYDAIYRSDP